MINRHEFDDDKSAASFEQEEREHHARIARYKTLAEDENLSASVRADCGRLTELHELDRLFTRQELEEAEEIRKRLGGLLEIH